MLDDSYAVQDGCHNCRLVFVRYEHDNSDHHFCNHDAPERPPCNSVAMDEVVGLWDESLSPGRRHLARMRARRAWDKWSKPREVVREGKCKHHEGTEDE